MKYRALHSWDVTSEEARQLQNELRTQVIQTDRFGTINTVAGVDIGLKKDTAIASVVVLSFPELQVVDSVVTQSPVRFPYIPGLLSFREIPPLLTAFANDTGLGNSRWTRHRAPKTLRTCIPFGVDLG